jgi:hypothetical protein
MKYLDIYLLGWLALKLIIDTSGFIYLIWRLSKGE